ncbi:MAG: HdeD family acid-resistance protein [Caldilineaceae bacterium]|nr:HdeD family acid-resistance protein [Caldilineaceae bacterium]
MNINKQLADILARDWWLLLLRGLLAIAFGIFAFAQPQISLVTLVIVFGAYVMLDGILTVWSAFTGRTEHEDWWLLLLWGLMGMAIGAITFLAPDITSFALLFYIAVWVIATGIIEIVAAVRLRQMMEGEWMLILAGVISVLFGLFLVAQPGAGAITLLRVIAVYAIIFGVILVGLALRVRGFTRGMVV